MLLNNSKNNLDLQEAYKSVYQNKELVSPQKDPEAGDGVMGPIGAPKKPQGGDHVRVTGETEPQRKSRYRAAYEEFKTDLKNYHLDKFNTWLNELQEEGYDIEKWEPTELIDTYIKENNLWKSKDIIHEAVYGGEKKEPEDKRMVVTKADKTGNTKAWQNYKSGHPSYTAAPHLKSDYEPEGELVDEAKVEADKEDWQKSNIRNKRRHDATGTTTPFRDRLVAHTSGRGVKKERGVKEEYVDEGRADKKLPEHERSAARLSRYDNPSGALALGGGQQRARRTEHEERRGIKKEEVELEEKRGLWDNIHARRKKGLPPKKPGQEGYPKTLNIEAANPAQQAAIAISMKEKGKKPKDVKEDIDQIIEGIRQARKNVGASKCWTGKKLGNPPTKMKGGKEVPNCVDEAARNAYAIGTSVAMRSTGDTPPLKKSTIKKAHKIARAIEKEEFAGNYQGPLYAPHPDLVSELNRLEKETGKDIKGKPVVKGGTLGGSDTHSKVMRHMHSVMGAGRMGAGGPIQPRGKKKDRGGPTPGPVQTPAQKVAKRRADAQRSQEMQNDTRGT